MAILKIWDEATQSYKSIPAIKGERGEVGPQGPQGEQGPKGDKGDKGDQGESSFEELRNRADGRIALTIGGVTKNLLVGTASKAVYAPDATAINKQISTLLDLILSVNNAPITYAQEKWGENRADASDLFKNDTNLLYLPNLDTTNVTTFQNACMNSYIIKSDIVITQSATNLNKMFQSCSNLISVKTSKWDISNVTNMTYMFYNCKNLTEFNFTYNKRGQANYMINMFGACKSLAKVVLQGSGSFSELYLTSMFSGCNALTSLSLFWDCDNVVDWAQMFSNCWQLSDININHFTINENANTSNMFYVCPSLSAINFKLIDESLSFSHSPLILVSALIRQLSDRTGKSSKTLTLHPDVKSKLTPTQIAQINDKNWTIA